MVFRANRIHLCKINDGEPEGEVQDYRDLIISPICMASLSGYRWVALRKIFINFSSNFSWHYVLFTLSLHLVVIQLDLLDERFDSGLFSTCPSTSSPRIYSLYPVTGRVGPEFKLRSSHVLSCLFYRKLAKLQHPLDHQHRQFPNKWLSALQSLPQPCELFTFHDLPDCTEADNPCTAKTPVYTLHLTFSTLHIALYIACQRHGVDLELTKYLYLTKIITYRNRINSYYIFASN
jgi:hypothetical protein